MLSGEHSVKETLSRHRAVSNLGGAKPQLPSSGFVAPSASVVGDVAIGEHSSVWYGAVVRGDVNSVKIGDYTNLQDGAVIHVAKHNVAGKPRATLVGNHVTVGHGAILHACTLEDACFVGMGATVMDGAVVQKGSMVAAGALITPGTTVPTGQIWAGAPAKFLRAMTAEESAFSASSLSRFAAFSSPPPPVPKSAENYARLAHVHAVECGCASLLRLPHAQLSQPLQEGRCRNRI